jgi:transcriptional regulator with XRE-family HTH domain
MTLSRQLGTALVTARGRRRLSRKRLAETVGLAPNTLGEVEHGTANPTLRRVEELADVYGVDVTITVKPRKDRPA